MRRHVVPVVLAILILLPLIVLPLLFERLPPNVIGVKQARWGGGGIVSEDYSQGFQLGISGFHLWHYLPLETHFLHFTGAPPRRGEVDTWDPPQEIRTRDNNVVTVELSVPYRIVPGEGHLIVQDGLKYDYRHRVKSTVERVLRSQLSTLSSEDLQDTDKRIARSAEILPLLNAQLAQFHCEAEGILIRRFRFSPQYEEKLQEKQYLRQKANLDYALTAQANEQKTVNLIERQIGAAELALTQDWEKKLQEKTSEYQVLIADIAGQANVYSEQTRAEGDAEKVVRTAEGRLAMDRAEALRDELRTKALQGEGGRVLIGLQAAKNLDVKSVTLNSGQAGVPMLLDLEASTRMLVGD